MIFISNLIPLWSDDIVYITSILLNLLKIVSQHSISPVLLNVPHALEKNAYSVVIEWRVP